MFEHILNDIEKNTTSFLNYKDLGRYLDSKYFNSISNKEEEYRIFKNLWKLVFKVDDEKCKKNRKINRWAMYCILLRNRQYVESRIKDDIKVLESKLNLGNKDIVKNIVRFLNISPSTYRCFSPDVIQILDDKVTSFGFDNISLFKITDIKDYILNLETIGISDSKYIISYLNETDNTLLINQFAINQFLGSNSYDEADAYFDEIISARLTSLSDQLIIELLEGCNNNGQIYYRRKSRESNQLIRNEIEKRGLSVDWTKYTNLRF